MVQHYDEVKTQPPIWDRKYLTGDWGGGRAKLARDGVTIGSSYVADILGNPIGGNLHASDSDHHPVLKIVHPVVECGVGHH